MDTSSTQPEYLAWHPPSYHVASPLRLSRTTLELDPDFPDNFPRTAKCVRGVRPLFYFLGRTNEVDITRKVKVVVASTSSSLAHLKTCIQPAPIVDFAWYPGASQHTPPTFCFVASVRDCPVKLLDAQDGRLRASYPIVDHRERYIAPHSLAFNLGADRLYAGFEDAIEIFDIQRPGEGERLHTTPSKKSKDGLKGIISALAFSWSPEYYAAGSLTQASEAFDNIALFNESVGEPVLSIGGVAGWEKGGVTQLMFSPTRPHILYAAFRRGERLWSWDLRGNPSAPLCCFLKGPVSNRSGHESLTNQKRQFDVEADGRWLACGNQFGEVAMYALENEGGEPVEGDVEGTRQAIPALVFDAHDDAIGAVAFHPLEPRLLSVSGSRNFDQVLSAQGDSASDSDSDDGSEEDPSVVSKLKGRPRPSVRDASIKIWDFKKPDM